jgi:hypothetical protein
MRNRKAGTLFLCMTAAVLVFGALTGCASMKELFNTDPSLVTVTGIGSVTNAPQAMVEIMYNGEVKGSGSALPIEGKSEITYDLRSGNIAFFGSGLDYTVVFRTRNDDNTDNVDTWYKEGVKIPSGATVSVDLGGMTKGEPPKPAPKPVVETVAETASTATSTVLTGTWEQLLLGTQWGVYEFGGSDYKYWMLGQVDTKTGKAKDPDEEGTYTTTATTISLTRLKTWGMTMTPKTTTHNYALENGVLLMWGNDYTGDHKTRDKADTFSRQGAAPVATPAPAQPPAAKPAPPPERPRPAGPTLEQVLAQLNSKDPATATASGRTITLKKNVSLSANGIGRELTIPNGVTLILRDAANPQPSLTLGVNSVLTVDGTVQIGRGGIAMDNGAKFTINGQGTLQFAKIGNNGSGLAVSKGNTATIQGVTLKGFDGNFTAILTVGGVVTLDNAKVTGNTNATAGGVLISDGGKLELTGGAEIRGNSVTSSAGGAGVTFQQGKGGELRITKGTIFGSNAGGSSKNECLNGNAKGAAILAQSQQPLVIKVFQGQRDITNTLKVDRLTYYSDDTIRN